MTFTRRLLCLTAALTLAASGSALAFAPAIRNRAPVGRPAGPRIKASAFPEAPSKRAAEAFGRFSSAFAGAQGVRWNADSASPRSVWGFRSARVAGSTPHAARLFLAKHRSLFGTDGSDLRTRKVARRLGVRHVRFQQVVDGIPVEGATVAVHMDSAGRVLQVDSTYKTGLNVDSVRRVTPERAAATAQRKLGGRAHGRQVGPVLLVVRPTGRGKASLAYKIEIVTRTPAGDWVQLVDAHTGRIVSSYNNMRFAQAYSSRRTGLIPLTSSQPPPPPLAASLAAVPSTANSAAGWQTITSQGFESTWPSALWERGWSPPSTPGGSRWPASWGKTGFLKYSGSYSIWPAAWGRRPVSVASTRLYPNNLDSWAVFGPFSMANAYLGQVTFKMRINSEPGYDLFSWLVSPNGSVFTGRQASGREAWHSEGLSLSSVSDVGEFNSLAGESNVWFALNFSSDGSVQDLGPFVDSLLIRKYVEAGSPGTTVGTFDGFVFPSTGADPQIKQPFAHQYVLVGPNRAVTDAGGNYTTPIRGNIHAWMKGPYCVAVNSKLGAASESSISAANHSYTWDFGDPAVAGTHADDANLFYHVNKIHDYYKTTLGFSGMDYPVRALAHLRDQSGGPVANAFYDPSTGFIYFGDGDEVSLLQTSRAADVIYHEYTHGVADHILDLPYQLEPGAMSEGYADYFAASYTDSATVGEWVFTDPTEVRNLEYGLHPPDGEMRYDSRAIRDSLAEATPTADWWALSDAAQPNFDNNVNTNNDGGWVHHNSLIFSGALWDLRNSLGQSVADRIILESLYFWPYDLESSRRAMKLADDALYGDSNLGNGTPNEAAIDAALALHAFPASPVYPIPGSISSKTTISAPAKAPVNRYLTFRGFVEPYVLGANSQGQRALGPKMNVYVRRYYSGAYHTVATLTPRLTFYDGARSKFQASYKPTARGKWRVWAQFPGGIAYAAADGTGYYFTVRPSRSDPQVPFTVY